MGNFGLFDTFLENVYNRDMAQEEEENIFPGCNGQGRPAEGNRVTAEDIELARTMEQIGENPLVVFDGI